MGGEGERGEVNGVYVTGVSATDHTRRDSGAVEQHVGAVRLFGLLFLSLVRWYLLRMYAR